MSHHARPKLACSCCDAIVQVPASSRPIERGIVGPSLLAHILVAKFADHLLLYRQSVNYAREGVDLDRALLASWFGAASALMRPLVDAIRRHVLAASMLHVDDTAIPMLAPGNGKTKTARLCTAGLGDTGVCIYSSVLCRRAATKKARALWLFNADGIKKQETEWVIFSVICRDSDACSI